MTLRTILATASALAAVSYAAPSSAATIILNDVGGVTGSPAQQGFAIAAKYWESVLVDPVTVNLNVGFSVLNPGVLGSTGSTYGVSSISSIYGQLAADAKSALDFTSLSNLQALNNGALTMITPGYNDNVARTGANTNTVVIDSDGSYNNRVLGGTSAGLKALGFDIASASDASITFSSEYNFDFDPTDGIGVGQIDFIGVATHEIGHALGFTTGTDFYDIIGCPDGPFCDIVSDYPVNDDWIGELTDLYRYSGPNTLNWAPGLEAYFSIDGGSSEFLGNANMSTGRFNGDGYQASHWKANGTCSNFIGIMNPYLCSGTGDAVTAQDLGMMDAIGWDISFDVLGNPGYNFTTADMYRAFASPTSAVPEPAAWLQLLLGFGALGAFIRNTRRKPASAVA